METNKIYPGKALEVLKTLPDESIDCCMTSPPYWALRDYGVDGQLGLEKNYQDYIDRLCDIFDEVKRVLKIQGSCWINLGDTYSGANAGSRWNTGHHIPGNGGAKRLHELARCSPPKQFTKVFPIKSLCMIPERFAIEMIDRGWILRNKIIWHKPNIMPSSARDRFTVDFEYLFFFVKNKKYHFKQQFEGFAESSIARLNQNINNQNGSCRGNGGRKTNGNMKAKGNLDTGRNKRTVWPISNIGYKEAHFATYPEELCKIPIKAGCPAGGIVLDPFCGSGTTGVAALKQNKKFIGIELNESYIALANKRLRPLFQQTKLDTL